MSAPGKFAHVVYKTHRFEEMITWYEKVFDAKVQHKGDHLAFLTYDEEHHRFAFINLGPHPNGDAPTRNMDNPEAGVHHVAYTWDSLNGLLDQYQQLKEMGVEPVSKVRHGPTLSMYYADPDGNGMEFQVDLISVDAANEFMTSAAFAANSIGEPFDPDTLLAAFQRGEDVTPLVLRSDQPASDSPVTVPLR